MHEEDDRGTQEGENASTFNLESRSNNELRIVNAEDWRRPLLDDQSVEFDQWIVETQRWKRLGAETAFIVVPANRHYIFLRRSDVNRCQGFGERLTMLETMRGYVSDKDDVVPDTITQFAAARRHLVVWWDVRDAQSPYYA